MGEYCAWHNYQLKTVKKKPLTKAPANQQTQKSEEKLRAGLDGAQEQAIR